MVCPGSLAFESSSAKIRCRLPVFALITTMGAVGLNAWDMSVSRTGFVLLSAVGLSSPGMRATIMLPGLNPSLRLYSATLIWTPAVLVGIASLGICTRNPVALVGSAFENRLSGKGSRQGLFPYGWQSAAGLAPNAAGAAPSAEIRIALATPATATRPRWTPNTRPAPILLLLA